MRRFTHLLFLFSAIVGLLGCSAQGPLAPAGAARDLTPPSAEQELGDSSAQTQDESVSLEAEGVARALRTALDRGWQELRVVTGCREGGAMSSAEVFGSGTAIWNGRGQYSLSADVVRQHLLLLAESGFSEMRPIYGGKPDDPRVNRRSLPPPPAVAGSRSAALALVVKCSIELALTPVSGDAVVKRVVQRVRGEQHQPFLDLAEKLLLLSRTAASDSLGASDVDDGLDKLASGRLAAETFRLQLQRRPSRGSEEIGWLLEIAGTEASFRILREKGGYTEPTAIGIDRQRLASLAGHLSTYRLTEMPTNLRATDGYTDLRITILDQEHQIQARGSGRRELEAFDRRFAEAYGYLADLYRVLKEQAPKEQSEGGG